MIDRTPAPSGRKWVERLLLSLPRGGRVLDLGCGGGEPIARQLIDHGVSVTGVDLDRSAVDLARTRFPREQWIEADMRVVALDGPFAGVIAWRSLSALNEADHPGMATRIAGWLAPGGRALIATDAGGPALSADHGAHLTGCGLVLTGHVPLDPGGGVWLARKP